jgi:hypothetical protein
MVENASNPSYFEGGDRRIVVQDQLGQKCEALSEKLKAK